LNGFSSVGAPKVPAKLSSQPLKEPDIAMNRKLRIDALDLRQELETIHVRHV
jgi:hypothetical protein